MIRFCQQVNLPDPLINRTHLTVKNLDQWVLPIKDLSTEFHELLTSINVRCYRAQMFWRPANTVMNIHVDGYDFTDHGKLNFIYDGENSFMRWYEPDTTDLIVKKTSNESGNQPYLMFSENSCKLLYERELLNPHLVEVGIPHNIISKNPNKDRYCLSLIIGNKDYYRLPFHMLVDFFKPYI